MSCVFNDPECNAKGEAGVPHPSKPGAIVYGLCTCPGVSYRYGICTGIPEAYLPSFDEFYRNMTGESLTLDLSQPVITAAPTPEEMMGITSVAIEIDPDHPIDCTGCEKCILREPFEWEDSINYPKDTSSDVVAELEAKGIDTWPFIPDEYPEAQDKFPYRQDPTTGEIYPYRSTLAQQHHDDPWCGTVDEEPEVLVKRLQFIKLGIAIGSMNEALKELQELKDSVTEKE